MPCPRGINISGCFAAYNAFFSMGWFQGLRLYMMNTGITSVKRSGPENCTACGKCESHCPQKIKIIECLKLVRRRLEPLPVQAAVKAARFFVGLGSGR
jgi:predicted aldo/keto reductase-like oxidoreductase